MRMRDQLPSTDLRTPAGDWPESMARVAKSNYAPDEVRWGDSLAFTLDIPAASAAPVLTTARQIVQARHPARVWTVQFQMQWVNKAAGTAGETMSAFVRVLSGVGSGVITLVRGLNVPFASLSDSDDGILTNVPAQNLVVEVSAVMGNPVAGAARQYLARINVVAAPLYRAGL